MEEVLGETNKFCHLNDMLSCYCGVSLAISARVGSALKKGGFGWKRIVYIWSYKERFMNVAYGQFFCIAQKPGSWLWPKSCNCEIENLDVCGSKLWDGVASDKLCSKCDLVLRLKISALKIVWAGYGTISELARPS